MSKTLIAALLVATAGGCRMCSDSCDYSAPVAGSPYDGFNVRAGSAFTGEPTTTAPPTPPQPLPSTTPDAGEPSFGE